METAPSRLVRCRFDSARDLYRHLRVQDGFFVPGRTVDGEPGDRVMVEVQFPDAQDRPTLHGQIVERGANGVWLQVRGARTTARWSPGPGDTGRGDRRVACDLFAELQLRGSLPWLCRVIDLSARGLRIAAAAIELGVANDELQVVLLPPDPGVAPASLRVRLAWAGARDAGLEILEADAALPPILDAAQARWEGAPEFVHRADCHCTTPLRRAG